MSEVNHPDHYNQLPIECIDVIQCFDFITGSIIKYLWRYKHKGQSLKDLKKAKWYLEYLIDKEEKALPKNINIEYNDSDAFDFNKN